MIDHLSSGVLGDLHPRLELRLDPDRGEDALQVRVLDVLLDLLPSVGQGLFGEVAASGSIRGASYKPEYLRRIVRDAFGGEVVEIPPDVTVLLRPLLGGGYLPVLILDVYVGIRSREGVAEEDGLGVRRRMLLATKDPSRKVIESYLKSGVILEKLLVFEVHVLRSRGRPLVSVCEVLQSIEVILWG